jgi:hypothetical protein
MLLVRIIMASWEFIMLKKISSLQFGYQLKFRCTNTRMVKIQFVPRAKLQKFAQVTITQWLYLVTGKFSLGVIPVEAC